MKVPNHREHYEQSPKRRLTCGQVIPYEKRWNKFCSRSCSAKTNNLGVAHNPRKHPEACAYCGKEKRFRQNKYCDECIATHIYNRPPLEELKSDVGRRRYLLRTRENRCVVCGLDKWMGKPIPLDIDHIDGNPDHNTEENLRLICPNCHAQTETYKGRGTKMGRFSKRKTMRRTRYAEGKSY